MTTATFDEAIADVAADTKQPPLGRDFDRGVSIAVFPKTMKRDDGTEFTMFTTNIERRYKDKSGKYQSTSWFDENQLAVVEDFAREARRMIRDARSKQKTEAK